MSFFKINISKPPPPLFFELFFNNDYLGKGKFLFIKRDDVSTLFHVKSATFYRANPIPSVCRETSCFTTNAK